MGRLMKYKVKQRVEVHYNCNDYDPEGEEDYPTKGMKGKIIIANPDEVLVKFDNGKEWFYWECEEDDKGSNSNHGRNECSCNIKLINEYKWEDL